MKIIGKHANTKALAEKVFFYQLSLKVPSYLESTFSFNFLNIKQNKKTTFMHNILGETKRNLSLSLHIIYLFVNI